MICSLFFAAAFCLNIITCPTLTETITIISIEENFNPKIAIRIAKCESQLGLYDKNWEGSSATGIYQFMPKTFKAYCQGDINNNIDQIRCFVELYPKHPSWWKCK